MPDDIQSAIEQLQSDLLETRGEAFAARIVALYALDWHVQKSTDPTEGLDALEAALDRSITDATFDGGDAAYNERVREVARMRAGQMLDAIRKSRVR